MGQVLPKADDQRRHSNSSTVCKLQKLGLAWKIEKKEATGIHFVVVAVSAAAAAAATAAVASIIVVVVLVVVVLTAGAAAIAPFCLVRIPIVCCPH